MIIKLVKLFYRTAVWASLLSLPRFALAQAGVGPPAPLSTQDKLKSGIEQTEIELNTIGRGESVAVFIQFFLIFVGVVFLINMIYGGYTWLSSQGNEEKIAKAKKTIATSVIGTVIVALSYIVSALIVEFAFNAGLVN